MNNINDLKIYIQQNYPLFLTNDLTLFSIIDRVVSYTNNLIERNTQLANNLNSLIDNTNTEINTIKTTVENFIDSTTNDLADFKNTINTQMTTLTNNVNQAITNKSQQVDTALNNLDVPKQIEDYFNTLTNNEYFTNLFNSRFGNVYNLVDYGSKPSSVTNFGYCYEQNTLYYGIEDKWTVVDIDKSGLYLYNNQIYIPVNNNGNWILEALT